MNDFILAMTLLVKNEEESIEQHIRFHKLMGIDVIIVTDNNSTDNTMSILKELVNIGLVNEIIFEPSETYYQSEWVHKMVCIAKEKYGAQWVISSDADEYWFSYDLNLKQTLINNMILMPNTNVFYIEWKNCLPWCENNEFIHQVYFQKRPILPFEQSVLGITEQETLLRFFRKVIFSTAEYHYIHQGNHNVDVNNRQVSYITGITLYHFTIKSYQHFEQKVINGGKSYEKHPNQNEGYHWRNWYKNYKDGLLREIYTQEIHDSSKNLLLDLGIVGLDKALLNYFLLSGLLHHGKVLTTYFTELEKNNLPDNIYSIQVTDHEMQKKFAKLFLNFIELEIFSFCNRTCWFCPNSHIDRRSKNILMNEDVYISILKDLQSINYGGAITYSRYNEPLAFKEIILTRIQQAREYLPNAFLFTHTNGDYVNGEYLLELDKAGLDLLKIQCYLGKDEHFDIEQIVYPKFEFMAQKLQCQFVLNQQTETALTAKLILPPEINNLEVILEAYDFTQIGENRGASVELKKTERIAPCYSPFYRMYIDYDGSIMPCCQLRHDVEHHTDFILGNVTTKSIFEVFSNEKSAQIREHLESRGKKVFPCNQCHATTCTSIMEYFNNYLYKKVK